ncbi:MAG: dimethyl sulfoxide reductase anchor subunit, partial [Rhodospirillales bacterium]|nr:dimethyl sulfoxide reductase anchor subunit [Rhodospirillales bacterium]
MNPAYSVIFFTTASGAGYGLLFGLGVFNLAGLLPGDRWFGLTGLVLALGLISFGLLSSTFHLGHAERSWRAVSQWQSSWLSREGVAALVTYAPALTFGFHWGVAGESWWGGLAALGAGVTVYCTSMIYVSLRPIPRWNNSWVSPVYLILALGTGAIWLDALLRAFGQGRGMVTVAVILLAGLGWLLKAGYWK